MRKILLLVFLASSSYRAGSADTGPAGARRAETTIKYPSDLGSKGEKGTTPYGIDFVLHPVPDFRSMYCASATLDARIAAGVCSLDFGGPDAYHKEVPASAGATLGKILRDSHIKLLSDWNGRPTLRVIKQRAIIASQSGAEFLKTSIEPGDFIIIHSVD